MAIKIGIVEDEWLIAESIRIALNEIGYETTEAASTYEASLEMIKTEKPDLLMIDIMIDGKKDGVDLAETINKTYKLPFIFLTGNYDAHTIERAKNVKPSAYIVKPFREIDLYTAIEIALLNFKENNTEEASIKYLKNIIFIKEGDLYHKVELNDIIYIKSENVYLSIFTSKKTYLVRSTMESFLKNELNGLLFKIHKSYAVNLKYLESLNTNTLNVAGMDLPVHKNYKEELLKAVLSLK
jgi:two-component system response regulator LytT